MIEGKGKVYIVGAGPGDAAYLTVKAQQLLAVAEVLVYDALVDTQLLELVPKDCLKLDVGKRGGRPSTPQAEINQLLVEHCTRGKRVVRLKSGDPFIFGRSSSEIQALIAAGCVFEVVPGISSALAAPLLAGIPLTDPVLSRCFAVVTAHDPDALDWEALARIDTLAILMGSRYLEEIVNKLHRHGRSLQTPVAIVRYGGCRQQQVWLGQLDNIVEKTAKERSLSPAVIVIGEVVGLQEYLQSPAEVEKRGAGEWGSEGGEEQSSNIYPITLSPMPLLTGKTILVTRSVGQSSQFSDRLREEGAKVIEMPALEIGPPSSWQALDRAIASIADFDWLILTSTNGVDYFFERLAAQGKDARALASLKIATVGQKTAQSLQHRGLQSDFIPPNFVADSLVEHFPEHLEGKQVLFPRVETGGREVLVKELAAKGANVVEVAAYESRCPAQIAPQALDALQSKSVDAITFASSKTVQNFCQLVGAIHGTLLADGVEGVCIASIGPQTSKTCQELLGRVDIEAEEYTLEGLVQALKQFYQ